MLGLCLGAWLSRFASDPVGSRLRLGWAPRNVSGVLYAKSCVMEQGIPSRQLKSLNRLQNILKPLANWGAHPSRATNSLQLRGVPLIRAFETIRVIFRQYIATIRNPI